MYEPQRRIEIAKEWNFMDYSCDRNGKYEIMRVCRSETERMEFCSTEYAYVFCVWIIYCVATLGPSECRRRRCWCMVAPHTQEKKIYFANKLSSLFRYALEFMRARTNNQPENGRASPFDVDVKIIGCWCVDSFIRAPVRLRRSTHRSIADMLMSLMRLLVVAHTTHNKFHLIFASPSSSSSSLGFIYYRIYWRHWV